MKLIEWLEKERMSKTAFSRKTGIQIRCITMYIHQGTRPYLKTAKIIEDFTKGEVTVADMVGNGQYNRGWRRHKSKLGVE